VREGKASTDGGGRCGRGSLLLDQSLNLSLEAQSRLYWLRSRLQPNCSGMTEKKTQRGGRKERNEGKDRRKKKQFVASDSLRLYLMTPFCAEFPERNGNNGAMERERGEKGGRGGKRERNGITYLDIHYTLSRTNTWSALAYGRCSVPLGGKLYETDRGKKGQKRTEGRESGVLLIILFAVLNLYLPALLK